MQARDFVIEGLGNGELLSGMAVKPNERREAFRISVLWLAVGEAGESSEPPPVGCARIGSVPMRDCLSGKRPEWFGKDVRMFQPRLKVTGAGFDDAQGSKPSAVNALIAVRLRSSSRVRRRSPDG